MIYIDFATFRVLLTVFFHRNITEKKLYKKFGNIGLLLILLYKEGYLYITNKDNKLVQHDKMPYHSEDTYMYCTSDKANQYVQQKLISAAKWSIAFAISLASLIVSIIALIISQKTNTPIIVKLVQ